MSDRQGARIRIPLRQSFRRATSVEHEEFIQKLDQIEEQAQLTLAEFPKTLTKERQRMIIALVRYIRAEADRSSALAKAASVEEATVPQFGNN